VRLYDHLFTKPDPDDAPPGSDYRANLNPNSLVALAPCKLEPSMAKALPGDRYQFERQGYFCVDAVDSAPGRLVFNRSVSLRDSYAKIEKSQKRK
jgi:glutaminyl-tRNA synthetase